MCNRHVERANVQHPNIVYIMQDRQQSCRHTYTYVCALMLNAIKSQSLLKLACLNTNQRVQKSSVHQGKWLQVLPCDDMHARTGEEDQFWISGLTLKSLTDWQAVSTLMLISCHMRTPHTVQTLSYVCWRWWICHATLLHYAVHTQPRSPSS